MGGIDAAARTKVAWAVLEPSEMKSAGGATLAVRDDKSIVVSGPNPAQDTYTIVAPTDLPEVTGLKIETLTDENLAGKGPGRSVEREHRADRRAAVGGHARGGGRGRPRRCGAAGARPRRRAKFRAASADFSQKEFPVAGAIDHKVGGGGWAIDPEEGKQHEAVFELDKPLRTEGGGGG